tara:strand:- start:295 stop:534 length:240 start_codon:yes stop_codon:yes gene_type:complete
MEATYKNPGIESLLTSITGRDRVATVASSTCVKCDGPADTFKDEVSKREYAISGMCQRCQDTVFGYRWVHGRTRSLEED